MVHGWLCITSALVALLAGWVGADKPQLSSVQCNEDDSRYRVCHLTNLALWNGQLYYVGTNASLVLPEARLNERNHVPGVNEVIKVVTPEVLDAKLLAEGARADQAVRYRQALLFNPWVLWNFWHTTDDTAQLYLRFCHHLGSCTYPPPFLNSTALLAYQNGDPPQNFGLGVRQLYGCFASTMYQVNPFPSMPGNPHGFKLRSTDASGGITPEEDLAGHVVPLVLFDNVMLGLGRQMIPLYVQTYELEGATEEDKLGRMRYMRTCAGLEPLPEPPSMPHPRSSPQVPLHSQPAKQREKAASEGDGSPGVSIASGSGTSSGSMSSSTGRGSRPPVAAWDGEALHWQGVRPRVVLINRQYTAGRSILRLDEAYFRLKQQGVKVALAFLEGGSLGTQASIFNSADVLVIPHGAATGNFYFLPKHAVIIQVSSFIVHRNHDRAIAHGIPNLWYNITFNSIYSEDIDSVEPIMSKVRRNPGFQAIPPAWQAAALVNGTNLCLNSDVNFVGNDLRFDTASIPGLWRDPHEATKFLNYNLAPERLVAEVLEGMELWKQKSGWTGPSLMTASLPAQKDLKDPPQVERHHAVQHGPVHIEQAQKAGQQEHEKRQSLLSGASEPLPVDWVVKRKDGLVWKGSAAVAGAGFYLLPFSGRLSRLSPDCGSCQLPSVILFLLSLLACCAVLSCFVLAKRRVVPPKRQTLNLGSQTTYASPRRLGSTPL